MFPYQPYTKACKMLVYLHTLQTWRVKNYPPLSRNILTGRFVTVKGIGDLFLDMLWRLKSAAKIFLVLESSCNLQEQRLATRNFLTTSCYKNNIFNTVSSEEGEGTVIWKQSFRGDDKVEKRHETVHVCIPPGHKLITRSHWKGCLKSYKF